MERAGLEWAAAKSVLGSDDWREEAEANRVEMMGCGIWGVPSFRLLSANGSEVMALWGQDRLWLFAREIQRLLSETRQAGGAPGPGGRQKFTGAATSVRQKRHQCFNSLAGGDVQHQIQPDDD